MNLINDFIKSALSPVILHERDTVITINQACSQLKGAENLSTQGLSAWIKYFFAYDEWQKKLLSAIENGTEFECFLRTTSTGMLTKWLIRTALLHVNGSTENKQIIWLLDSSGEQLKEAYWDLYIKMNEALLTIQHTLDERNEALQQTNEAQKKAEFLASLPEINPMPILRINQKMDIVYANKAALSFLTSGHGADKKTLPPEITDIIHNVFSTGNNEQYEYTNENQSLLFSFVKINIDDDFVDSFAVNITEKKRAEKENREKSALIEHAGRLAALGEMATGVAHELNQPLSIIRTNLQSLDLLSTGELSKEDINDIVSSSIRQIDRASNIIAHMRSFARLKTPLAEPIDLTVPIESALAMFNEQFRLHEIEVVKHLDKNTPPFKIESQQMEQLVVNLLSNARYAVKAKKETANKAYKMQIDVYLKYLSTEKQILFQISDNGIGMNDEVRKTCFNPFFTTKPIGEGTGLGLSIIHSVVTNLHGSIQIESEEGTGTTISIRLPTDASSIESDPVFSLTHAC